MSKRMKLYLGLGFLVVFAYAYMPSSSEDLRHVVLIKFKDDSSHEDVEMVCKAFAHLESEISEIKAFEWGENNSPEGLDGGHTHCFLATFSSEADRDTYLTHPAHLVFVDKLRPHLDKVTVVDYWVQ